MSKPKKRKRHTPTQIIEKLRQADAMLAAGQRLGGGFGHGGGGW